MDRLEKIDKDELVRRMRAEFEKTMIQVTQAVNDAPDGYLVDGSEERCRDVLGEFRRLAYQTALQMRVDATEASAAFSPSGENSARDCGSDGVVVQRPGGVASSSLRKARRGERSPGR